MTRGFKLGVLHQNSHVFFFLRDDGWHPHPTVSLEVVQSLQNRCLSNLVVLDSSLGREGFCACFI